MKEMRDLTRDERNAMKSQFDRLQAGIVDTMLIEPADQIFADWASNLLYAHNEDTSLTDHAHLACMETAERYLEGIARLAERKAGPGTRAVLFARWRGALMQAGTRLVALAVGLVDDEHIATCFEEISAGLGAAEELAGRAPEVPR